MATAFEEKLRYLQEMGVDTPEGILQLLTGMGARGLDTPVESEYLMGVMDTGPVAQSGLHPDYLASDFAHQAGEGYNQGFDSWSPEETQTNLGLPDTAAYKSGYSTGTGVNPNWGSGKYNYQKNIYDIQTINMMINQGAINPKLDQIIPRPDVGEGQYEIKLSSADNTLWNDQLQMFMSPDWLRSGTMGQEQFKQNYMGGQGNYDSLRSNTYPGSSNQLLDFNKYS